MSECATSSNKNPLHQLDFVHFGPNYVEVHPPAQVWRKWPCLDYSKQTLWTCLTDWAQNTPESPFLGIREWVQAENRYGEYKWLSYSATLNYVNDLGSGLMQVCQTPPKRGDVFAIFSNNCAEWILAEYSMFRHSIAMVPLYATFGVQALAFCIKQADISVVFTGRDVLSSIIDTATSIISETQQQQSTKTPHPLKTIILMPRMPGPTPTQMAIEAENSLIEKAKSIGLSVVEWEQVINQGRNHPIPADPPKPEDLHSIIYTSGTCGFPKGAAFDHHSWAVTADKVAAHPALSENPKEEVHLSYLPLAHVYELAFSGVVLRYGARIGFSSGSPARLLDDIQSIKPTYLLGVPRVWKRIHDKVMESVDSMWFPKRWLFNWAYSAVSTAEVTGVPTWIDYNKLVFSAVRSKLGGKCRFICSAAAPLPPDLNLWLSRVMGVEVVQIYGLTEASGGVIASVSPWSLKNRSSTGFPCMHGIIRLIDVPELGYLTTSTPPRGEILCSGRSDMICYYKSPQLTTEALEKIDEKVWFHTGDIGQLNEDGTTSLIDRKKNLFKLAQGEYVPCELLETLFSHSSVVSMAWVHGESIDTFIIAIIVPNFETLSKCTSISQELRALSTEAIKNPQSESTKVLCESKELCDFILKELLRVAKENNLPHFQYPRGVLLEPEPWTTENGLATPTFKLKRAALRQKYSPKLQALLEKVRSEMKQTQKQ